MARSLQIVIDHDKCVGSRICVAIAPRTFALNDDGQARVADAGGDPEEEIKAAVEGCPLGAITIEETDDR